VINRGGISREGHIRLSKLVLRTRLFFMRTRRNQFDIEEINPALETISNSNSVIFLDNTFFT